MDSFENPRILLFNFTTESTLLEFSTQPTPWWVKFLQGVATILLALGTVFGNFLVIFAVVNERRLRSRVTNMFISSLACADFLIGSVVLPFAIYDLLTEGYWIFGSDWCDVWHAFDVLCSTASITNLCVIAVDRFWAITKPMSYQRRISRKIALGMIGVAWTSSAAISFPCIWWWRLVEEPTGNTRECIFPQDPFYLVLSSFISFYIPSVIMIVLYIQVYRTAVRQVRAIRTGTKKINGRSDNAITMRIHQGVQRSQDVTNSKKTSGKKVRPTRMNKEHKAARTLGIVMGVFIGCWLPFFVVNVTAPLCPNCIPIPHITFPTVTWLGYANSAINPIIYAFTSRTFQHAFKAILCRDRCLTLGGKKQSRFHNRGATSTSMTWFDASEGRCSETESPKHRYTLPFVYF